MSASNFHRADRADRWLVIGLGVLILLEVVGWQSTRRTESELQRAAESGPAEERVWALHILLNRGEPLRLDEEEIRGLLASDEALVREMAMTHDVWRHGERGVQREYLAEIDDCGEVTRGRYYLKRHGRPASRRFLRSYFRSFECSEP